MTPEQKYRLELAKEKTPTTSSFIIWIPCFVILALLCRTEPAREAGIIPASYHPVISTSNTEILTIFGWSIL